MLWTDYSQDLQRAFATLSILCVLLILVALALYLWKRGNYLYLAGFAFLALGPLTFASAWDFLFREQLQSKHTLRQSDTELIFSGLNDASFRSAGWSHFSVIYEQGEDRKAQFYLHHGLGPSFLLETVRVDESAYPEKVRAMVEKYSSRLDLPTIDNLGLILSAGEKYPFRPMGNPFEEARRRSVTVHPDPDILASLLDSPTLKVSRNQGSSHESEEIGLNDGVFGMVTLEYGEPTTSATAYGAYWLLVCFLGMLVLVTIAIWNKENQKGIPITLWVALPLVPLLWFFPRGGGQPIRLHFSDQGLMKEVQQAKDFIAYGDMKFIECEMPGTGIVIYRGNPESILFEKTSSALQPGAVQPNEGNVSMDSLLELGYESSAAAFSLFTDAFRIPTGLLSPVERIQLCAGMGQRMVEAGRARKAREIRKW